LLATPAAMCRWLAYEPLPPSTVEQASDVALTLLSEAAFFGRAAFGVQASRPAAGIRAGLGALDPQPSVPPNRHPRGACRRPCRQGNTHATCMALAKAIRRQDCALHLKPPPQSGASRQACHAGGRAGRATHTPPVRRLQRPSAAKTGGVARKTARSTSCRRRKVEQAARLGMPAAVPAEEHTRHLYDACKGHPARKTARSTSSRRRKVENAARLAMPAAMCRWLACARSPSPPWCRLLSWGRHSGLEL